MNNKDILKEKVDKIIDDLIADVHYEKTYPAHTAYYQLDFNKMRISLEKEIEDLLYQQRDKFIKKLEQLSLCVGNEWSEGERYHAVQNLIKTLK